MERVRSSYLRRGFKIVGSNDSPVVVVKERPPANMPVNPRLAAVPQRTPARPAASQTATNSSIALRKLRSVYRTIEDKALYMSPVLDLYFGGGKEKNIDDAGNQTMIIGGEAYNSVLLYTILTNVVDNGSMILYGPSGSGKTSSSRYVASAIRNLLVDYLKYSTIFGHPEQTEEKMIAMYDPIKMVSGERELIIREFLKSPIKLIDEINRLRPESTSLLLELLNSGSVTYQDQLIRATPGPVFATANPSDRANHPLVTPLKDRFNIAVLADRMNPFNFKAYNEQRARGKGSIEDVISLDDPITPQDLMQMRQDIYSVDFPSELMSRVAHFFAELTGCDMAGYVVERKTKGNLTDKKPPAICQDCDHYSQDNSICSKTEEDVSPRAYETVYTYAKAIAYWRGNQQVGEDDVRAVVPFAVWFRVATTRAADEIDPRFKTDKISLFDVLYQMSGKSYEEIVNAMPEYERITSMVFSSKSELAQSLDQDEIEALIETAGKLDTPAKYPLLTTLKKLYHDAK